MILKTILLLFFFSLSFAKDFKPVGVFFDIGRTDWTNLTAIGWKNKIIQLQTLGFNTAVAPVTKEMLKIAEKMNFKIITYIDPKNFNQIREFEKSPSLLSWYGIDEPDRTGRIQEAKDLYREFKKVATKPLAVSLYLPKDYIHAIELADIAMPDPYIFGHIKRDGTEYPITEIAKRISSLHDVFLGDKQKDKQNEKKIWAIPQLYAWYPHFKRPPTPVELEIETIMCLAEGSSGIVYFAFDSGSYFPNPPSYEPKTDEEETTDWNIFNSPLLIKKIKEVNKTTKFILNHFQGPAERTLTEKELIYRWKSKRKTFTATIQLQPLKVSYSNR